tara:strand:+ start:261 stop:848 length:588 start_codon:yes stop_codon:yes gene_type:complete
VKNSYKVKRISYADTKPFILDIHYAKRMPSISYAYGLYKKNNLIGIISYGSPVSPSLCKGIAGENNRSLVLELNRLVLKNNEKNQASILIGASLKLLPKPKIIVSYADTAQNHLGVVYQATNFMFTGTTKPRTDMAGKDGKHSRHHLGDRTKRVYRSAKHRYVYILGNKKDKRRLMKDFNYEVMPYPKEKQNDNQ